MSLDTRSDHCSDAQRTFLSPIWLFLYPRKCWKSVWQRWESYSRLSRERSRTKLGFHRGSSNTVLTTTVTQYTEPASTSTSKRPSHCGCKQWTEKWGETNKSKWNNTVMWSDVWNQSFQKLKRNNNIMTLKKKYNINNWKKSNKYCHITD